jgi:LuxR family transcriptional regulator, maltose regulon positive regulatory protein
MREATPGEKRRRVPRIKVAVPALPRGFVSRPRLLSVLDRAPDVMVTVVCAPAGSGKTLLLADWARRRGGDDTAWVSLDGDDNDDRRFWSAVLDALAACPSVPPGSPLRSLPVPEGPSRDLSFLAMVVNALDELPVVVRLVLDDVHELSDQEPLSGLETLLRHQPAKLRLVLSSRHNPPLPLARLRLADQLAEIRVGELQFSLTEARALLEAADVELPPDQLRQLVEQTEGWAAGLRLAATSLAEADDPARFLAEFAENDRAVAEYLIDEVLSRLPDELREFLRTISVCDAVSADLGRAVSGHADAGTMLGMLERKTSLLTRTGDQGRWYRTHALVRSSLLADLTRQAPGRAAALHARAADWFSGHGRPLPALAHAARTGDAERVAALLRREAVPLALAGEYEELRRGLKALGDQLIGQDSRLALVAAMLLLETGEPKIAALQLAHAEAAWPAQPTAELETLRRLVQSRHAEVTGDVDEIERSADALELAAAPELDPLVSLTRGTALLLAGRRPAEAGEWAHAAAEAARQRGQSYVGTRCLTVLSGIAGVQGDVRAMTRLAAEADREATAHDWQRTTVAATAAVLLAYGALLRAETAETLRQVQRAASFAADAEVPPGNRSLSLLVGVLGGTARFETGAWTAGLRQLRDARMAAGTTRLPPGQAALSAVLEHRAAMRFGWGELAQEVVNWSRNSIADSGEMLLMRARTHLALGRPDSATKILHPFLDGSVTAVLPWSVVEAALVETEAAQLAGEGAHAVRALKRALSAAQVLGVRYPLVFAADEVMALLAAQRGRLGAVDSFADEVLGVRRGQEIPPIPVPLTNRERSVLRLLPTLRSFEEIAEDLTVSPNTVKTHVRSIYTKLGVRRRRDAVTVALERGLLEDLPPQIR